MFLKSFFITLHYSFYKRYFLRCFLYSTVNFTTNNAHCQIAQSVERLQCVAVMESNASSTPSNDVHKRADSYKVRKYQNTKSKTQEHRSLRVTNYPFCKLGKFVNFAMFLFKTYGSIQFVLPTLQFFTSQMFFILYTLRNAKVVHIVKQLKRQSDNVWL